MKLIVGKLLVLASLSFVSLQALATEVLWIDVRSTAEYQEGHLSEAINISHTEISERIGGITTKDAQIKLYCGSGRRAGIAQEALEGMGYTLVSNEGGYSELLKNKELPEK